MRILIDIKTKANQAMVKNLIAPAEGKYDEGRYLYQTCNADRDAVLTDVVGFAMYHPTFETMDKYKETGGIAVDDSGDTNKTLRNIYAILNKFGKAKYGGWELKTFIAPILYRQFITHSLPIDILDGCFDLYPYDQKNTLDLSAVFNFNRQMVTTRSRNQYYLKEMFSVYGGVEHDKHYNQALVAEDVRAELVSRIEMAKFLFNKWGFEW